METLKEVDVPRYAILGNHDPLAKVPVLEAGGVQFLLNEQLCLWRGDGALTLVAIA